MNKSLIFGLFVLLLLGCTFNKTNTFSVTPEVQSAFAVELGHYLFFDKGLSFNFSKSCSSCHDPRLAFTDGYRKSLGATADLHQRNSSSLINISQNKYFTQGDSTLLTIEKQLLLPLFNEKVLELGLKGYENEVLDRIKNSKSYQIIFKKYNKSLTNVNWELLIHGLASYCRNLNSYNSKYDLYLKSYNSQLLSSQERLGMNLFFSDSLGCGNCHNGANLNNPKKIGSSFYAKNGFYEIQKTNVNTLFSTDYGLYNISGKKDDIGRFRIPSLRNVLLTSPYMHDGSFSELSDVIKIYSHGGVKSEFNPGNMNKFSLTKAEIDAVISFLGTLTDTSYMSNPLFNSPFTNEN